MTPRRTRDHHDSDLLDDVSQFLRA